LGRPDISTDERLRFVLGGTVTDSGATRGLTLVGPLPPGMRAHGDAMAAQAFRKTRNMDQGLAR